MEDMSNTDHYKLAWKVFKEQAQANLKDKEFKYNDALKHKITAIANHLFETGPTKFDPEKGFMLQGRTGQGKTMLMQTIKQILQRYGKQTWVETSAIKAVIDFRSEGEKHLKRLTTCQRLFIDDLGSEETVVAYGAKRNIFEEIIFVRHENWKRDGYLTHFTTNLSMEELKEKYGKRNAERLFEMSNWVTYEVIENSFRMIK